MFYWLSEACLGLGGCNWLRWQYIRLASYAQFYHSSFFVFCAATSSIGVVYFMFFFMGACSHFSFRVLVTPITVYIFCVLLFVPLISIYFLHLIKKNNSEFWPIKGGICHAFGWLGCSDQVHALYFSLYIFCNS